MHRIPHVVCLSETSSQKTRLHPKLLRLKQLRSDLQRFKGRLWFIKIQSDSPLPDVLWHKENLNDLSALVHSVYMAKHLPLLPLLVFPV